MRQRKKRILVAGTGEHGPDGVVSARELACGVLAQGTEGLSQGRSGTQLCHPAGDPDLT